MTTEKKDGEKDKLASLMERLALQEGIQLTDRVGPRVGTVIPFGSRGARIEHIVSGGLKAGQIIDVGFHSRKSGCEFYVRQYADDSYRLELLLPEKNIHSLKENLKNEELAYAFLKQLKHEIPKIEPIITKSWKYRDIEDDAAYTLFGRLGLAADRLYSRFVRESEFDQKFRKSLEQQLANPKYLDRQHCANCEKYQVGEFSINLLTEELDMIDYAFLKNYLRMSLTEEEHSKPIYEVGL